MEYQPIKFNPRKKSFNAFCKKFRPYKIINTYPEQLRELFMIRNPKFRFGGDFNQPLKNFLKTQKSDSLKVGSWFYFPWNRHLVHYLPENMHQELRTARNKNLITQEEQEKFYNFKVGIAGLSVGSHAALTLAMMGGSKILKLSDFDALSGSNLNRIRGDFTEIGLNKCDLITQKIYQLNPYAKIYSFNSGIISSNIKKFLAGPPKLDILIESVDNPELKIKLRIEARKLGIPVIMATDNGDNIIFDIERFDLNRKTMLFNGVAGNLTLEQFQKYRPQELPKLATKLAGEKMVVPKMLQSVLEVGRSLYSWPQLGDAASLAGVASAYVIKRLALGQRLKTGKMEVNLDSIFDPDYKAKTKQREKHRQKALKNLGF